MYPQGYMYPKLGTPALIELRLSSSSKLFYISKLSRVCSEYCCKTTRRWSLIFKALKPFFFFFPAHTFSSLSITFTTWPTFLARATCAWVIFRCVWLWRHNTFKILKRFSLNLNKAQSVILLFHGFRPVVTGRHSEEVPPFFAPRKICFKYIIKAKTYPSENVFCLPKC